VTDNLEQYDQEPSLEVRLADGVYKGLLAGVGAYALSRIDPGLQKRCTKTYKSVCMVEPKVTLRETSADDFFAAAYGGAFIGAIGLGVLAAQAKRGIANFRQSRQSKALEALYELEPYQKDD
jgi:hypothetical protein